MTDKTSLRCLINVVKSFSTLDSKMQLHTLHTFLEVALADLDERDFSNIDIQARVGLQSGTATRNMWYWTEEGAVDMTGNAGFVEVRLDPKDRRKRRAVMTAKGRVFLRDVLKLMN